MTVKESGLTPINDMADMYLLLKHWHSLNIQQAHHLSKIPKGTELQLQLSKDDNEEPIKVVLDGDTYSGFIAGIVSTMAIFENLPFQVIEEEVDMASSSPEAVH